MFNTVFTYRDHHKEFIAARDTGARCEIDREMYWYYLEVLPPIYMSRTVQLIDGSVRSVSFGFAEGAERITAFWTDSRGDRFFAQHTNRVSRGS